MLQEYLSHHRAVSLEVGVASIPPIKVSLRVRNNGPYYEWTCGGSHPTSRHLIGDFRTGAGTDIVCRPPCGLALA